ncbi:Exopolysaccharide biosynthesis protein [Natronincola peptidivorans]|uniref:Exopolysaccharide biosynthesis protein n=1 Tax=Natronincola peptidivorans TaxID=426128 RepID=A0A1H9ZTW4_9FIRM|nr:phosphodiester glycosidase family protein [Natronincola peptidivorans]SES85191.1 Exopolysaccharide biosynthesis protein [Natronincola peptidivorans]
MFKINLFLVFLAAPFLALFIASRDFVDQGRLLEFPSIVLAQQVETLQEEMDLLQEKVVEMGIIVENQEATFRFQEENLSNLSEVSATQRELSDDIYEERILNMLGPTVATYLSNTSEIKIFQLAELGYRGYIAKIKLFDPSVFQVALAEDTLGKLETTSNAARRKGAILAINGGGFYMENRDGKPYARLIGNTVIDGRLVEPFNGYPGDLFFTGVNRRGQVIGTVPSSEQDIRALDPYQGISFIPVLLKDGKKVEIPDSWKTTNQPRTIIGKYANDDLIMIVIDGRQNDWSIGVTLELLQDKLLELGVKEAYNLDGGGSSAMYFNGQILNKPSDGKERPVANNILIMP